MDQIEEENEVTQEPQLELPLHDNIRGADYYE